MADWKKKVLVAIPSYKRADKDITQNLVNATGLNKEFTVKTFVYSFDPQLEDYKKIPGINLQIIPNCFVDKANLARKRNYILDYAIHNGYEYLFQMDDDIDFIGRYNDLRSFIVKSIELCRTTSELAVVSPAIEATRYLRNGEIEHDAVTHSTAFMDLYRIGDIRYIEDTKCEDASFCLSVFENKLRTVKLNSIVIHNKDAAREGEYEEGGLGYKYLENGISADKKAEYERQGLIEEHPFLYENGITCLDDNGILRINHEKLEEFRGGFLDGENN